MLDDYIYATTKPFFNQGLSNTHAGSFSCTIDIFQEQGAQDALSNQRMFRSTGKDLD